MLPRGRQICVALLLIFLFAPAAQAAVKDEAVFLPTRQGVIQPFLITSDSEIQPQAIAILFPGSAGNVGIKPDRPVTNGNFLVRSRQIFVQKQFITVVIDAPSDAKEGMNTQFRSSSKHAADVAAVIDEMNRRFPGLPVYLIGTSRGTISAAYAGEKIQSKINGIVLTSTVFRAADFPPNGLKLPVLLVHNVIDGCSESPYSGAIEVAKANGYQLISVNGGPPASGREACGPFSPHGYLTKEEETISAIANWIIGKPFDKEIQ